MGLYRPDPPTPAELKPLASEVAAEFVKFSWCSAGIVHGRSKLSPEFLNLFLDSFHVHARALIDFFGAGKARGDDLVATHYVPDWGRGSDVGQDLAFLQGALAPAIYKRLAHLTAYRVRVEPEDDALPLFEIVPAMASLMYRFLNRVDPEQRLWFATRAGTVPDPVGALNSCFGDVSDEVAALFNLSDEFYAATKSGTAAPMPDPGSQQTWET